MKAWLLTGILALVSTTTLAQESTALQTEDVAFMEMGSRMYRKVDSNNYEIGDVIRVQDVEHTHIVRKARVLRIGNRSIVFEVIAMRG